MTTCLQLPTWIVTATVAGFGAWIAARQMWISNEKLRLDAFARQYERRVAVYEATRKILASAFNDNISDDEIRSYGLRALDAQFLFDDGLGLYRYLREIHQRIAAWRSAKLSAEASSGDEQREYQRIQDENLNWIIRQGDERAGFSARFIPFLVHKESHRPWWLRWP